MDWYEELPEQCPEKEAFNPDNEVFYRVIDGDRPELTDFISHRLLYGEGRVFPGMPECRARSVSLFKDLSDIQKRTLKTPKFKNKKVVKVLLKKKDGVIAKTSKLSHYSWWRSKDFNLDNVTIVENE